MEQSVRNALQSLASGNEQLDPNQVMRLQDQLSQVDTLFTQLRSEVTRLNSLLAEQKDANDALRQHNLSLLEEVSSLRKGSTIASKSPKTKKKKSAAKKNLTRKSK